MWHGKLSNRREHLNTVAFAPDGRTIYTGDSAGYVLAWDVATHERRELYRRPKPKDGGRGVYTLWPTPDGKRLLCNDRHVLRDLFLPDAPALVTARVTPADEDWGDWRYLLPDGKRVISCEPDWKVGLWDLETGKRLPVPGALGKAKEITYHYLFPDGETLLTYQTARNTLPLWNLKTGERIGKLAPSTFGINPCAMAQDCTTFVVGRDEKLWVYDVPARQRRHLLKSEKNIRELAFHPGGRLVASADSDNLITLWDVIAGKSVTRFDWKAGCVAALAFSPDGLTCAVAANSLVVFDIDF